jgi:putative hydrolase of the HAD superfamily
MSEAAASNAVPVKAIAFDWGGVFTQGTFDGRAVRALASLIDLPEDDVAGAYYPLMERFEVGEFDLPTFHERLTRDLGVRVDLAPFRSAFLDAPLERTAMYQLLAGVPERYAVAMLSNNVPELCDRVRADPRMARVERFVFSNEIAARKPDAAAFAALTEALELAPEATVFVDDNAANVAACQALGFRGLLLDTPTGFARRWRALVPDLAALVAGPEWS